MKPLVHVFAFAALSTVASACEFPLQSGTDPNAPAVDTSTSYYEQPSNVSVTSASVQGDMGPITGLQGAVQRAAVLRVSDDDWVDLHVAGQGGTGIVQIQVHGGFQQTSVFPGATLIDDGTTDTVCVYLTSDDGTLAEYATNVVLQFGSGMDGEFAVPSATFTADVLAPDGSTQRLTGAFTYAIAATPPSTTAQ